MTEAQLEWQHLDNVMQRDPETAAAIQAEYRRQTETLEMIASENFASRAVLEAAGCVMTNKYAEGLPGKRYYGGCEHVDVVERLAIERAKKLFHAPHANVQPHSGAQANFAVYLALLNPGDTIMGMNLAHGGHLTHGSPVNVSGKYFKVVAYGVNKDTERIDYDDVRAKAREHKPKLIIAGASAYPRIIDFAPFREIADEIGAYFMTDMAHISGLVAARLHPNPVESAHVVTSTTHKTLRGPRSGFILSNDELSKSIDKAVFPGSQGGPLMHIIAAKAVAFLEALQPEFRKYQQQIIDNAKALGEELVRGGLRLCSGGTDNHLLLVDLTPLGITGRAAEVALEKAGITVNKNMIPFDTRKPMETSGIRIGTPALTTRGLKENDMRTIGAWIVKVLRDAENENVITGVRRQVEDLSKQFPLNAWE